jgi:hypothetical protein
LTNGFYFPNDYSIAIVDNIFINNTVVRGIISLINNQRDSPVVISNNTFTKNLAYFGSVTIFIRSITKSIYHKIPYEIIEDTVQCGGYLI